MFETIVEANVDMFTEHPIAHTALTAVAAVGAFVVYTKLIKKLTSDLDPLNDR